MQKYQSIISGTNGSVIRNVPVTVLKEDGSLAEIFMDREGQVQAPNPLVTDSRGVFYFYAKNGRYSLRTAADGVQITDADTVLLFDPDETASDGPIADAVRRAEDAAERAETALEDSGLQNLVQDAQDAAANAAQAVIDANQAVASIDAALIEAGEAKDAAQAAAQTASNAASGAQAVKDSLLTYSGTLSATPEWSAVPAHEDLGLDAQTQAALNRVEKLKDDQQLLKQRSDKSVLSYPDYAAASAAAATLPDGQLIDIAVDQIRWVVIGGALEFKKYLRDGAPEDFGETGLGDDSYLVQAFIDSCHKVARLPDRPTPYVVTGIVLDGKTLAGDATLRWKGGATTPMFTLCGRGAKIGGNLKLDGNSENTTYALPAVVTDRAPYAEICCAEVTNFKHKFFQTDVGGSKNGRVSGVSFIDTGKVSGCDLIGLRSSGWLVLGNTFDGIGVGHVVRVGLFNNDSPTPVRRTRVVANNFEKANWVGVCLELYAQDTIVEGNSFKETNQHIKAESAGGTVRGLVVSNNTFESAALTTALNLSADGVQFRGNICYYLPGGPYFGGDFDCSNNQFIGGGMAGFAMVRNVSPSVNGVASFNIFKNITGKAIEGTGITAVGNRVFNATEVAFIPRGANNLFCQNHVSGAPSMLQIPSSVEKSQFVGNTFDNISGTPITIVNTPAFNTVLVKDNGTYQIPDLVYTLASDAITISISAAGVRVDTESGAATDELSSIFGGVVGQRISLKPVSASRVTTVKDNVGNLRLAGDFVLNSSVNQITLLFSGSTWDEVSRSINY